MLIDIVKPIPNRHSGEGLSTFHHSAEAFSLSVIPAKAGISSKFMFKSILQIITQYCNQIPAFAGMTRVGRGSYG
jgi:hypothetical protein